MELWLVKALGALVLAQELLEDGGGDTPLDALGAAPRVFSRDVVERRVEAVKVVPPLAAVAYQHDFSPILQAADPAGVAVVGILEGAVNGGVDVGKVAGGAIGGVHFSQGAALPVDHQHTAVAHFPYAVDAGAH
jgi:hypothetical protein